VVSKSIDWIASMVAGIVIPVSIADAKPHMRMEKAQVRFLASGTLVRGTSGFNNHLAELQLGGDSESISVRLLHEHPNEAPSLSETVLSSVSWIALRVRRDSECDSANGHIFLRAAPG
jgi:hypothetical protein